MKYKNKKGVYSVEFSIVAALFFMLFFAVIEGARLMYTWNVLTEVTRRGARLATVCNVLREPSDFESIKDHLIPNAATAVQVFRDATFADDPLIPDLGPDDPTDPNYPLKISYLKYDGTVASTFSQIRLVRAEIDGYEHQLLIPFIFITLNSPSFSTTLPAESLGVTRYGYTDCL